MKQIKISERTLILAAQEVHTSLSFKEKVEIARLLELLNADVVEFPKIEDEKIDTLLLRTAGAFLKNSIMSLRTGYTCEDVNKAYKALSNASKPRLCVSLPVSPVGMEYTLHKKAPKLIELIKELVSAAAKLCGDVEFSAEDATRAEKDVLKAVIEAAVSAGATTITVNDSEGAMLPDDFAEFIKDLYDAVPVLKTVKLAVMSSNKLGLAAANTLLAIKAGAVEIKTACDSTQISGLLTIADIIRNSGDKIGVCSALDYTQLNRISSQIGKITALDKGYLSAGASVVPSSEFSLTAADTKETVSSAIVKLGYDLTEEDIQRVYESFKTLADKKPVSNKELDAIVASTAMQVPQTYTLASYVINNGNIITPSANIVLEKNGEKKEAISMGDGPIDAAFLAIEQIAGQRLELDDFQIQAVTEGTEALGSAVVKLRSNGKLYSGKGISTDIIGAAITAYINALNKIIFEEN